jgi:hypothetical protein
MAIVPRPPMADYNSAEPLTQCAIQLLLELMCDFASTDDVKKYADKKEFLLGSKQSIIDAVIALKTLDLKQTEITLKTKASDAPMDKGKMSVDDIKIIEEFLSKHAQDTTRKLTETQTQKNAKKRLSTPERDIAP